MTRAKTKHIAPEILRSYMRYSPETGQFTRIKSAGRAKSGAVAGHSKPGGYVVIKIEGETYQAHRLAFLYMTGKMPEEMVDHINGDPSDNRWENLRAATSSQNMRNRKPTTGAQSMYLGVTWHPRKKVWRARIKINGNEKYLGGFHSEREAAKAYNAAAIKYFGEFARPNCGLAGRPE